MPYSPDHFSTYTARFGRPDEPATWWETEVYTYESGRALYDVMVNPMGRLLFRTNMRTWGFESSPAHQAIIEHFSLKEE